MHLIATGESPFRDREFDRELLWVDYGHRYLIQYKKLAEQCCDADPDKRPVKNLVSLINDLIKEADRDKSDDNVWKTIYHNVTNSGYSSKEDLLLSDDDATHHDSSYDISGVKLMNLC